MNTRQALSQVLLAINLLALSASGAMPLGPMPRELDAAARWSALHLNARKPALPFAFTYGGRSSAAWLSEWSLTSASRRLDGARRERVLAWADPQTGLSVRCVAVAYTDYPVVEWTVYFKNVGQSNTLILEDVQGLDTLFERGTKGEFVLHGIKGDFCAADSFEPYQLTLAPESNHEFSPPKNSGKSCDGPKGWPYYNLQFPGGGVILAIGWPGQWASGFRRDAGRGLRVKAGQQRTHLALKPGEEIRTPLIAVLFWKGDDVVRAQNLWRRWFMAHNLARTRGEPQPPAAQIQVGGGVSDIAGVKAFLAAGIKPDICWRDAGGAYTWYPNRNGPYQGNDAWLNTGTWEVDAERYPQGFRPFSDWVRSNGMQFLLWFEPERVGDTNCWLAKEHPEWLLPGSSHGSILDLGNPSAFAWLVDHLDTMIKTQGLDWYREDMNGEGPAPAWRKHDSGDRQGMTENGYVRGHLALWDELRRRNPGLRIDSCASGGRRDDLESMRRAVPLLRSDFQFPEMKGVVEGNQGHTYGLSSWLPFQGTGCYLYDSYSARSFYLAGFGMGGLSTENAAAQRQAYAECQQIAPMMLADFYPLTPYSRQSNQWIAWQFNRPDRGDGCVQAFRRGECAESTMKVGLNGLDPAVAYELKDLDANGTAIMSGKRLMKDGLSIEVKGRPGAAIIQYRVFPHSARR